MGDFLCQNLTKVALNKEYLVMSISDNNIKIKHRLLQLGFIPLTKIMVLKKSILKKTYLVQIDGNLLCLREDVCKMVSVK